MTGQYTPEWGGQHHWNMHDIHGNTILKLEQFNQRKYEASILINKGIEFKN